MAYQHGLGHVGRFLRHAGRSAPTQPIVWLESHGSAARAEDRADGGPALHAVAVAALLAACFNDLGDVVRYQIAQLAPPPPQPPSAAGRASPAAARPSEAQPVLPAPARGDGPTALDLKEWDRADQFYGAALRLLPEDGKALHQRAVLCTYVHHATAAMALFFQSLAVDESPFPVAVIISNIRHICARPPHARPESASAPAASVHEPPTHLIPCLQALLDVYATLTQCPDAEVAPSPRRVPSSAAPASSASPSPPPPEHGLPTQMATFLQRIGDVVDAPLAAPERDAHL
ncbi:hypothetical protein CAUPRSCDRAFT_12347, partial [Caulochytrium protostelioides]